MLDPIRFRHSGAGGAHGAVSSVGAVRVAVFCAGKIEACSVLQCDGNGVIGLRAAPVASVAAVEPEGDRRDGRRLPAAVFILVS